MNIGLYLDINKSAPEPETPNPLVFILYQLTQELKHGAVWMCLELQNILVTREGYTDRPIFQSGDYTNQ